MGSHFFLEILETLID